MFYSYSLVGASLLWNLATSNPINVIDQVASGQTFSLEQVEVERTIPWSAPHEVARTYWKYGVEPPEGIQTAVRHIDLANADGPGTSTVPVIPFKGDTEYLLKVQVGNHNLTLDPDTGSADLWVFSNLMPASQRSGRPAQRVYEVAGSGGKKLDGHSWQIRYGDGSGASGQVYMDKVTIGSLTVQNQAIEAASTVSGTFSRDPNNDGLLGLAFSKLNTIKPTRQKTWFDNIAPKLKAPLFTVAMKRRAPGTYDFGFVDPAKHKGEIIYTNVGGARGFWDFPVTGFIIAGQTITKNVAAVADTGSSLWYLPGDIVKAYYSDPAIAKSVTKSVQGMYSISNCKGDTKLPDITVLFAGKKLTIPGINVNYQPYGPNSCFGGIQEAKGNMPMIFGDVFLKNLFVVHEMLPGKQPRLGFALAA
ncbi:acid protease [Tothia fuscella]|uniref:Acid protease n=1 Tax=Tothia fuscella TaxID=1048955 RepID=A0A9P4TVM0_9PEZI|nr:acid protease [Tothia fuscella]